MAQRSVPQPRDLLPAPGIRSPLEGDDGSGAGGSGSGKAAKRSKVTAVACVPCQKRKSKVGLSDMDPALQANSPALSVMVVGLYVPLANRKVGLIASTTLKAI